MNLILSDAEIEHNARVYQRAGLLERMSFEQFLVARQADVDLDERVRVERAGPFECIVEEGRIVDGRTLDGRPPMLLTYEVPA